MVNLLNISNNTVPKVIKTSIVLVVSVTRLQRHLESGLGHSKQNQQQ
jgi:hypothetical protein